MPDDRDFLIQWRPSYSIGVPSIDQQHKLLVSMVAELQEAMLLGETRQILGALIQSLVSYADYHFAWEERLLAMYQCPQLESQREAHARLREQVLQFQRDQQSGRLIVGSDLMRFLQHWLLDHILVEDRQAGNALLARGAGSFRPSPGDILKTSRSRQLAPR